MKFETFEKKLDREEKRPGEGWAGAGGGGLGTGSGGEAPKKSFEAVEMSQLWLDRYAIAISISQLFVIAQKFSIAS